MSNEGVPEECEETRTPIASFTAMHLLTTCREQGMSDVEIIQMVGGFKKAENQKITDLEAGDDLEPTDLEQKLEESHKVIKEVNEVIRIIYNETPHLKNVARHKSKRRRSSIAQPRRNFNLLKG